MTAINVLRLADEIHVVTDGLVTHTSGKGSIAKVMPLPHLNAVLVTRGSARLLGLMSLMLCSKAGTFADLRPALGGLEATCAGMPEQWQIETFAQPFDVVVAGIGREGPAGYLVPSHGSHGIPAWTVFDIPYCLVTPTVSQAEFDAFAASGNPVADLLTLVEAQRLARGDVVGSFAQITTVRANGITTQIMRDWRGGGAYHPGSLTL